MLKYIPEDTSITFAEIPYEICLCINVTNCPHRCEGCHSPYLREDIGEELTFNALDWMISKNKGVTCVVFMGGDSDKDYIKQLALHVSSLGLKSGWYSGETSIDLEEYGKFLDYIKVGPYIESLGPLNAKTTNQRLYKVDKHDGSIEDVTFRFWK